MNEPPNSKLSNARVWSTYVPQPILTFEDLTPYERNKVVYTCRNVRQTTSGRFVRHNNTVYNLDELKRIRPELYNSWDLETPLTDSTGLVFKWVHIKSKEPTLYVYVGEYATESYLKGDV